MSFAFFWLLLILMILGLPIAFALMIAPGLSLLFNGQHSMFPMLLMRMYNGMDSFPLMAIPYFILARASDHWEHWFGLCELHLSCLPPVRKFWGRLRGLRVC